MPFELPDNLEEIYMKKMGKDTGHAPSTLKLYKSFLNKIATAGYNTPALLMKNKKKVLAVVKDIDKKYHKTAMTSIFYALSAEPNSRTTKGLYYDYYQVLKKDDVNLQDYKKKHDL